MASAARRRGPFEHYAHGLLESTCGKAGIADVSVLDDHDEALRLGYASTR
jgi:hypothetical protein